jgi:capsular polysaccharide biosynthesis protein
LIPKGFTYLNLDNYDNSQQISFFENASAIVAIHGAALSNIVFTRKDCQIFEIFNHPYRTYFFRELARIKSNRYFSAESSVALGEIEIWLESIK